MCVFLFYYSLYLLFVCLNAKYLEFNLACTMQNLAVLSMYVCIYLFLFLRIYSKSMVIIVTQGVNNYGKKLNRKKSQPAQSRLI